MWQYYYEFDYLITWFLGEDVMLAHIRAVSYEQACITACNMGMFFDKLEVEAV